MQIQTKSSIQT